MNEAGLAVQQVPAQALPAEWWTAYGDPLIDALVRNALEHNTDLAIARARIDEAVAITRRTRASMFPSLALTPQATRARDFSLAPTISSDARLPLSASWEVDLAGRLSHAADGARMDAVAVEQNWFATRWQIAFETVSAALQQRQAAELEDLAKERLQVAERLERLTEQKFKAGQATGFDIERTRSEVIALRVEQEQLRRVRGEATHALDVLVGRIPGALGSGPALASHHARLDSQKRARRIAAAAPRRQSRAGASCSGDGAMERSRRRAAPQTCARFEWWAPTLREQRNTCGREHFLSGLGCDASDL